MAGEDARLKSGLKTAEDELNLIKNQIQQTLLDIREHILDVTNPFNDVEKALGDEEEMAIEDSGGGGGGAGGGVDEGQAEASSEPTEEDDESSEELGSEDEDSFSEDETFDDDLPEEDFEEIPEDDVYGSDPMGGGYSDGYGPGDAYDEPLNEYVPEDEEIIDDDVSDELIDDVEEPVEGQEDAVKEHTAEDEMVAEGELDLIKLASLVRWVAVTQSRLGPQRTEVLLDTYVAAGRISAKVRNVMGLICDMADEDPDGSIPVRDIIASMVRMEGVLSVGAGPSSPNRLLGMLLELDDDPLDRLVA